MDFNFVECVQEYLFVFQEFFVVIVSNWLFVYWLVNIGVFDFFSVWDVEIKYVFDFFIVFKGLFDVKVGEKIGLIGCIGSGKLILGMSLLRFIDFIFGSIFLDGIDIIKIGVDDLVSFLQLYGIGY